MNNPVLPGHSCAYTKNFKLSSPKLKKKTYLNQSSSGVTHNLFGVHITFSNLFAISLLKFSFIIQYIILYVNIFLLNKRARPGRVSILALISSPNLNEVASYL